MHKTRKVNLPINCSIFSDYKERIQKLAQSIDGCKILSRNVDNAHELYIITKILLHCPKYDERDENCQNCHFLLNLRQEVARLIIETNRAGKSENFL